MYVRSVDASSAMERAEPSLVPARRESCGLVVVVTKDCTDEAKSKRSTKNVFMMDMICLSRSCVVLVVFEPEEKE